MIVGLTEAQYAKAQEIGRMRQQLKVARGANTAPFKDNGGSHWDRHMLGAIAEYALAVHFGVLDKWLAEQAYSEEHWKITCDVGNNLHVRATDYQHGGLILHPYDKPANGVFVLGIVRPNDREVLFIGWILCGEGKSPDYWRDWGRGFVDRPAFLVPQSALRPFSTIPQEAVCSPPSSSLSSERTVLEVTQCGSGPSGS